MSHLVTTHVLGDLVLDGDRITFEVGTLSDGHVLIEALGKDRALKKIHYSEHPTDTTAGDWAAIGEDLRKRKGQAALDRMFALVAAEAETA